MILDTSRYKFSNNPYKIRTLTMKWWLRHRDTVLNTQTLSELISSIIELSDDDCVENNIYNLWNDYIIISKS
ncbi:Uncharacterised protein [Escherichia coli]|nr:Uncharacterised protein [Escherichia coli]